ncbi:MAG: hypothetical protein J2P25_12950 [Nocardiopsaceae bacterium]|nr:hypothetical protein [Nocardiopsaceae bacterium]
MVDARWAARQSGYDINHSLTGALAEAREGLRRQEAGAADAVEHASRLFAEIQAAIIDTQRPPTANG